MNDTEWPEEAPAEKKSGVPKWVWFGCGGGCLLALLLAAVASFFFMTFIRDAQDPEKVWPLVAEALPFDERPEGWTVSGGGMLGTNQIVMFPEGGKEMAMLYTFPSSEGLDELFDPESMANNMVMLSIENAEFGEIEIQGRKARTLRFEAPAPGTDETRPSLRIDLTGDGSVYACLQVSNPPDRGPVSDEDVQRMLEPFDVWRGK